MNLTTATPTEYVWKYNPLSGIPAGAQQNYGSTINWVLPGGRIMANVAEDIRSHAMSPMTTSAITARFEAESDQQPYASPRESNYIAANVLDSGRPRNGLYPLDLSGSQRVQLSGGRTEGKVQLSGGLTEGRTQLAGGKRPVVCAISKPPRWSGASLTGNGISEQAEMTPDAYKYHLRIAGPSQVMDEPGVYSQREFMTKFVPAVIKRPFASKDPGSFPAQYSAIYKGRSAFEDEFWDW